MRSRSWRAAGVRDPRVDAAFAAVAREDFLGPGPWQIVRWGGGYRTTPDADLIHAPMSIATFSMISPLSFFG
jgi:protein-L-isoaspartate(D-aspartate) O-methyltransferase